MPRTPWLDGEQLGPAAGAPCLRQDAAVGVGIDDALPAHRAGNCAGEGLGPQEVGVVITGRGQGVHPIPNEAELLLTVACPRSEVVLGFGSPALYGPEPHHWHDRCHPNFVPKYRVAVTSVYPPSD